MLIQYKMKFFSHIIYEICLHDHYIIYLLQMILVFMFIVLNVEEQSIIIRFIFMLTQVFLSMLIKYYL